MSPRSKAQFEEIREATREKILEAALELFGTRGFNATSISEIGKAAGISKGLMYHYFASKDDLLREMIDNLVEMGEGAMDKIHSEDPSQMMRNLFELFFNQMRENFQQWKLIMNLSVQIEKYDFIHKLAIDKMQGYLSLFEELLTKMGWKNASDEAKIVAALFDGIGMQYFVLQEDYHLDEMEKILISKYCIQ